MSSLLAPPPGQADLVTLNRAATVSRLLSGVAHEVNNVLQVIGGTTELLQMTPALSEPVVEGLGRIYEQNARAAAAINELMAFARPGSDARGRLNVREIAARSVDLRSFAIGRARLTIALEAPAGGRSFVEGQAALVQLAVLNLIVNAEHALSGRSGGAIRVVLEESGREVVLHVSDNGPGVDPTLAERIFEPFFTTRPREEASGLGLTVARLVAEQHGGTLTLEASDAGAHFALRLPGAP